MAGGTRRLEMRNVGLRDRILEGFLSRQFEEGAALARQSDILTLIPRGPKPYQAYVARFRCKGLVRGKSGEVAEADEFDVGIYFPHDYVRRRCHPVEVLRLLKPENVWHPNISPHAHFICPGRLQAGTPLVDLIYQLFEILTYKKVTMREDDALNAPACAWSRENQHRFPVDRRPLKRRALDLDVKMAEP